MVEETKRTLWGMRSYKTPGPDGYHAIFFKKAWVLLGRELFCFVMGILAGGEILAGAA